jgi:hypothetical protein
MIKARGGGTMDDFLSKLKNLDAYPKINEDFYQRTLSGGVITIVSTILMLFLFFSEFGAPFLRLDVLTLLVHFKTPTARFKDEAGLGPFMDIPKACIFRSVPRLP